MTAPTTDRPTQASKPPEPGRPRDRHAGPAVSSPDAGTILIIAEVTLAAVTVAAAVGLGRLFVDGSFLVPVVGFALLGHAVAIGCRRAGLSAVPTLAAGSAALGVAVSSTLLPETTAFGLPTFATLDAAGSQLSSALATFREVVAPAPVEDGFILAAAIGVWTVAFTADTAAFRASAPLEAVVPSSTLFVFAAALGAPKGRLAITTGFLLALLAYWLAQRALTHATSPTWMATEGRLGAGSLLATGGAIAVAALVGAVVVGPLIPGADDEGIVPWRASDRSGPGSLVVVSPLVDIRARIVDQADVEVFRVDAEERSYWRLTSLETFDGRIWSSKGQYRPARGFLEGSGEDLLGQREISTQEFEIRQLDVKWLPAAYEPVEIDLPSARYDADSGSLLTEESVATGLRYQVTSALTSPSGVELQAVQALEPGELTDSYTDLPDGFSVPVQQLASRIAGDPALTPYQQALALQNHFRSPDFTYDLSIEPGHGDDALETFLFETRRGYCEQFAGAFAALARSVGLPARVAVGFTPGERAEDGRFLVRGLNGHAWPEVYFAGYGWVPFEPTPGRGIPGAESYTGVEEAQATPGDPSTPTTLAPTTTTVSGELPPAPTTMPSIVSPDLVGDDDPISADDGLLRRLGVPLALVLAVPAAWAALLLAAGRFRRSRRRARATTAADRVRVAWDEALEALSRQGHPRDPSDTPVEYARQTARRDVVLGETIDLLADATTAADFSGTSLSPDVAERAEAQAARIVRAVHDRADLRTRVRWAMDPRPLLPDRSARLVLDGRAAT